MEFAGRQKGFWIGAWVALLAPVALEAGSFAPVEFEETVKSTPIVVRGQVGMSYSDMALDPDGVQALYTFYEIKVSDMMKSETGSPTLLIRELGGHKDGVTMEVSGTAQFTPGEDVVVFLKDRNSEGTYDLNGMMMGKLEVTERADGSEVLTGPALLTGKPGEMRTWTIDSLKKLIKEQASNKSSVAQNKKVSVENPSSAAPAAPSREIAATPSKPAHSSTFWALLALGTLVIAGLAAAAIARYSKS